MRVNVSFSYRIESVGNARIILIETPWVNGAAWGQFAEEEELSRSSNQAQEYAQAGKRERDDTERGITVGKLITFILTVEISEQRSMVYSQLIISSFSD